MNGNQLFPGEHYAWVTYPRRRPGVLYPNAARVRAIRILSVEVPGYQKRKSVIEVEFLTRDGESLEPERFRTVFARNIVYRWGEHAQMLEKYEQERSEEQRLQREAQDRWLRLEQERREQREREETERRERLIQEREPLFRLLESVGIARNQVTIDNYTVSISRKAVEEAVREQSIVQS